MNTNIKGSVAEHKVMLRALEKGFLVSKPILPCRYDLVLDDGDKLYRAQVKYAQGKVGMESECSVAVQLRSWNHAEDGSRSKCKVYSKDEIDFVLVYIPHVDRIAKLGPDLFEAKASVSIRYAASKNKQSKGCNLLEELEW